MNGFERRKEQSKENILKSVEALISKYGISKVSVNDIAHKAGVSQVTIYNLFGSKDKLIQACIQTICNRFIERFREIIKMNKPYPEKLNEVLRYIVETSEAIGLADIINQDNPQLSKLMEGAWSQLFLEFIKQGKEQGYLNPDLSDEAIRIYLEFLKQSRNTHPEIFAKIQRNPKLFRDFTFIILHGFGRIK